MKRILMTLAVLGVFAASSMAVEFNAMTARVPFDFELAGMQFQAGTYQIERGGQPNLLAIRDSAGHVRAAFQTNPLYNNNRTQQAMLVFNKYGDRYFLSRVWTSDANPGYQLRKSRIERELLAAAPAEQVFLAVVYR